MYGELRVCGLLRIFIMRVAPCMVEILKSQLEM